MGGIKTHLQTPSRLRRAYTFQVPNCPVLDASGVSISALSALQLRNVLKELRINHTDNKMIPDPNIEIITGIYKYKLSLTNGKRAADKGGRSV